ncbi:hypothetical protein ACVC7V_07050 [Hydrogenophaga sp. A37]|uniref:hypothetical protein n=1 Tax=Hydrogenophaga sp. A37 TaxID=1945864 RepID=UPI00098621B2|nr:hypothetical protein [Hydrogenophaga sp. A37]OOG80463.1 hypothetical protein B0E41_20660 [Hydrogenophaga sp. A37]
MITVANRATPQPLSQEQQEDAMTSEGAPPAGQMPGPIHTEPLPTDPITRVTLHLVPAEDLARNARPT